MAGSAPYIIEVLNPEAPLGPRVGLRLHAELYRRHYKRDFVKYCNLMPAKEVLEKPSLIFTGVRELDEGGYCFVGRPARYCGGVAAGQPEWKPLEAAWVFGVYVSPSLWIYEWRLEPAEAPGSHYPLGHKERYQRLAWKNTF